MLFTVVPVLSPLTPSTQPPNTPSDNPYTIVHGPCMYVLWLLCSLCFTLHPYDYSVTTNLYFLIPSPFPPSPPTPSPLAVTNQSRLCGSTFWLTDIWLGEFLPKVDTDRLYKRRSRPNRASPSFSPCISTGDRHWPRADLQSEPGSSTFYECDLGQMT